MVSAWICCRRISTSPSNMAFFSSVFSRSFSREVTVSESVGTQRRQPCLDMNCRTLILGHIYRVLEGFPVG